jgi:hypothetical protein
MKIITTGENLRLLGSGALNDLFCFMEFFDPMTPPAVNRGDA